MSEKRKPSKLFWISLVIPLLVLMSMLIKPVSTSLYGEDVILATVPIDPRDLFYGDYVILDLEIKQLDAKLLDPSLKKTLEDGNVYDNITVYVSLREGVEGVYEADAVSENKPKGLYITGKMSPYIEKNEFGEENSYEEFVYIDYGIERYYVEEGTGLELEEQARLGKVLVSVKIHKGYPVITDLKAIKSVDQ
jgi:uncharacterized membrane-anchored protein